MLKLESRTNDSNLGTGEVFLPGNLGWRPRRIPPLRAIRTPSREGQLRPVKGRFGAVFVLAGAAPFF
jgi:hypothetical protein